jgi:MFS family permease
VRRSTIAPLFYFGMLVSSVGTFAFSMALIAFMLQSGFPLWQATLIIGLRRFVPVVMTGIWGHLTDAVPARMTVAVAEGIAALTSIVLLLIWHGSSTNYPLLVAIIVARNVVVAFQTGSRSKITKLLSDDTYKENSRHAIWLNKATQGATLLGGLFAWVIIKYANLEIAIMFDAATFVLNGATVLFLPDLEIKSAAVYRATWSQKFNDLFRFNKKAVLLDIVLAISMMGTMAYMARLAGESQSWGGLFMASYGLAVWISGYLERGVTSKFPTFPYWIVLAGSFLVLGALSGPSVLMLFVFFVRDLAFWTIFHRISSHIQIDTPADRTGGVTSARYSIMTLILASGEVLVGAWAGVVPIAAESALRASIALAVGLYLAIAGYKKVVLHDRPAL